jgi:hypothetical protein
MGCIDEAAKANGCPPKDPSLSDANSCYLRGECGIFAVMPDKTPTGRNRIIDNKKWGTVVKYMHKPKKRWGGLDRQAQSPANFYK